MSEKEPIQKKYSSTTEINELERKNKKKSKLAQTEKKEHSTDYFDDISFLIIGVFAILLFIVWIVLIYYVNIYFKSNPPSLKVYLTCKPGECSTIVSTGEKHCPVNPGDIIIYQPTFEVCNPKFACTDIRTPLAVMSNGETNIQGICEVNSICRCVNTPSCSDDTLVLFDMVNGNFYGNTINTSTRVTFQQLVLQENVFKNYSTQFCAIKANHLDRIAPGACIFADENNVQLSELHICMNQVNSCVTGQIAFVPENPNSFQLDLNNRYPIHNIPVSCMPPIASPGPYVSKIAETNSFVGHINNFCIGQSVPVYNKYTGKIECKFTGGDN